MLLLPNEAAHALNVDEKTVLRWIKNENLPAQRTDGQYQTHPVDLLEWATERGIKVNPVLYEMHEAVGRPLPPLSAALEAGGIHYGVAGTDKESVLRSVVGQLNLPPQLDGAYLLRVLMARESLGSTAIGDGIAVPHLRNPLLVQLPAPMVSLSYLARPLDFDALDGKPVQILFSIITPGITTHLHLLSELVFCLGDARLRRILWQQPESQMILATIREIERDIGKAS